MRSGTLSTIVLATVLKIQSYSQVDYSFCVNEVEILITLIKQS